jgi:hypothetical protein
LPEFPSGSQAGQRERTAAEPGAEASGRLWNTKTGKAVGGPLTDRKSAELTVFSPDGRVILIRDKKTARTWDTATGLPFGPPLAASEFTDVTFSGNGQRLLTFHSSGNRKYGVQLFDVETGRLLARFKVSRLDEVVNFSPDGKFIFTAKTVKPGTRESEGQLWDLNTGP